jgi:hypothetical protein
LVWCSQGRRPSDGSPDGDDAVGKGDRTAFLSLVLPEAVWTTKQGFVAAKLLADASDSAW